MITRKRLLNCCVLFILVGALLVACSPAAQPQPTSVPESTKSAVSAPTSAAPSAPTSAPTGKGTEAVVGMAAGSIDHLDPHLAYFAASWRIMCMTCTPLLTFPDAAGEEGKQVIGGLAELPEISADGKTYTFKLKPGIKFADGTPITGEDVKATFRRIFSPKLASPAAGFFTDIVGAEEFAQGKAADISGITVDGDKITFQLKEPMASFTKRLTMPLTCIVPKNAPEDPQEDGQLLVSGPYKVESYQPNRELVLVRNPNYTALQRGKFDRFVIQVGVDPAQIGLMIRANQLDLYLDNMAPADAAQALKDPTLQGRVFSGLEPTILYLWMNNDVPPFDNPKVRQAVNYAIDREAILRVWGGPSQGQATDQILCPAFEGWKDVSIYPNKADPETAKKLLAEAGVKLPINTVLRTINDSPGYLEVAQAIQAQLKEVGINVQIEASANSVTYGIISTRANKVPMGINSWTIDYPDPDNVIATLLDGTRITETNNQNYASFNSPEINAEIAALSNVTGPERAARWMALDEKIMREYAPWAPLLYPVRVDMISERVKVPGWVNHPIRGEDLAVLEPAQ